MLFKKLYLFYSANIVIGVVAGSMAIIAVLAVVYTANKFILETAGREPITLYLEPVDKMVWESVFVGYLMK